MPKPKIAAELAELAVDIDTLTPYHRNPRNGDTEVIKSSLATNGQYRPIVVNKGTHTGRPNEILAGNHTYAAACELGWDQIAVTWLDVDDEAATKVVLVDNRSADQAGYDEGLLLELLEELGAANLTGTGYTNDDLDELISSVDLPEPILVPTEGAGTGEAATAELLVWGFIQWKTTRLQITADEVATLDRIFDDYVRETGSAAGFVFHLAEKAHQVSRSGEAAEA